MCLTKPNNFMKSFIAIFVTAGLIIGCQPPVDNSASEAFEKNSKTVRAYLEGFQNESMDYETLFAEDFQSLNTSFNAESETNSLQDMIENDQRGWAMLDFELVGDVVLLPGVNPETTKPDGSVRYYGTWRVTKTATDSTEARTGEVLGYESFDFNEEGKILYHQFYGDTGSLWDYLWASEEEM